MGGEVQKYEHHINKEHTEKLTDHQKCTVVSLEAGTAPV